ncbi:MULTISPECIES: phosphoribulokinase [Robertmurraya]|uniref:Uridine kinase n=1 Tax=Robertmurraya beringensis TaxID=641660 RepID=A0ABV6KT24_9BACI
MEKLLHEIANWINSSDRKIMIGISGHGASGKTTFANSLLKLLDPNEVNYMNTDPYIIGSNLRKYTQIDYEYENQIHHDKMTACHPLAHHVTALERDIHMLKEGFNFFPIGKSSSLIPSKKVNIVEGMSVAFTNPDLFNLKIYFYTDEETELMRRSIRDVTERGTDLNYLRNSHKERRIQYELFMHPYHHHFDMVVKNSNEDYVVEKGLN